MEITTSVDVDEWEVVDDMINDYKGRVSRGKMNVRDYKDLVQLRKELTAIIGENDEINPIADPKRWLEGITFPGQDKMVT